MRVLAYASWRVVYPPTVGLLRIGAWLAGLIRRRHPLAPLILVAWMPIRAMGILAYWTCSGIEVALR